MPLNIRIQQHDFFIDQRYNAGHVLSEGEAQALNQIFAENIRNNVFAWVTRTMEESKSQLLTLEQHNDLQSKIARYAEAYRFRTRERRRPPSPIEAAADEIALQDAEIEGQQRGFPLDSQEVRLRYLQLRTDPVVVERARQLVIQRQAFADGTLKDMPNGSD
jgi:hypothetical protein